MPTPAKHFPYRTSKAASYVKAASETRKTHEKRNVNAPRCQARSARGIQCIAKKGHEGSHRLSHGVMQTAYNPQHPPRLSKPKTR